MSRVVVEGRDPATGQGLRLVLEGEHIAACDRIEAGPDMPWISAGLVDLQVNGYGGLDLNDGTLSVETVVALCRRIAQEGTTRFLPTLITATEEQICQRLAAIAAAVAQDALARAMIAGVHVEGPFISLLDGPRGAHPLDCVRPASVAEFARWQAVAGGLIRIITLAPEVPGAVEMIRAGVAAGITMSLGHSGGEPEHFEAAAAAGATMSTHLGNGIFATVKRHPNAIWTQLADDRLMAGLIGDGHHLPAATLKSMLRAKGHDRAFLVSDSVAVAGLPPGRYRTPVGGDVEVAPSGRVSLAGTVFLGGSGQCLRELVGRGPKLCDITLAEALALATEQPSRIMSLPPARLEVGARADVLLFDWAPGADDLSLRQVWLAGAPVRP